MSETFLKENKMSSIPKKTHLSSPFSCSCLSGLQRKHCHTVLLSFQIKTSLVCSVMWVDKANLPLDSRLAWTLGKIYSQWISFIVAKRCSQRKLGTGCFAVRMHNLLWVTADLNSCLCETSQTETFQSLFRKKFLQTGPRVDSVFKLQHTSDLHLLVWLTAYFTGWILSFAIWSCLWLR